MLSLYDDAATRVRAEAAGAAALVGKHEPLPTLLAAVRQSVAGRAMLGRVSGNQ
jgi:DNA-binding NarL/FixJ family response regulator